MKSIHHDCKANLAKRVGIFPLDLFQQRVRRLIGSNHESLTGSNVQDSSLHNHHTMRDNSWRIYAFIDQWKENRCSWNWWYLFRAFLMIGCPVACTSNCFFMRTEIYISLKFNQLLHIWTGWACSFVAPEFIIFTE